MSTMRRAWAVLLAASLAAGGCSSIAKPSASFAAISIREIGLKSVTLVFDVDVHNPYAVPLPLANVDYALASKGARFCQGKADIQGSVPAEGTKRLSLPAKVTYLELLKALTDIRPGALVPYVAEVGLSVKAPLLGDIRLPMKKEGQLPIPAVPDIDLTEIRWDKIGVDEIRGVVRMKFANRNQFPVDLSKVNYGLSLGDVEVAKTQLAQPVKCDPGGDGTVDVPISFLPVNAGLAVVRLVSGAGSGYAIRGEASMGTPFGPIAVPLEKTGKTSFRR